MSTESVKVAVRVRPFNQRERNAKSKCVISMQGTSTFITNPESGDKKTFAFDHSYWSHDGFSTDSTGIFVSESDSETPYSDQEAVFSDLGQGVLDNAWQGYNAALFAYGQTGSGKSYSMIGYGPNKGIVPITCGQLFKAIEENKDDQKQFQVTFSMLEIYNEQVRDLLVPSKSQPKGGLRVRQHPQTGFYVDGLKQIPTESYKQIERLMNQGTVNRTTASTNMNATSSRSHMVIAVTFKQIYKNNTGQSTTKSSRISLVDLAGSERAASSGATGDRLKEGSAINQSLSTLGKVISALADLSTSKNNVLVPYRDSVLTKLLQSALGGNSKTIMIAALSPAAMNYDETLSTLRYADRAKSIKNQATINENPTDKLIRELKAEKARLVQELLKLQDGGKDNKLEELEHMLDENRRQMADMQLTWEQRMEQARSEWQKSSQESPPAGNTKLGELPYLQNVNEDPYLSGVVKLPLETGITTLGKPTGSSAKNYVDIRGLRIQKEHIRMNNKGNEMVLKPGEQTAEIILNGKRVTDPTKLKHFDRIKLGSNNLYIYIGFPSERSKDDVIENYDYDYFQSELADGAGMGKQMIRSMSEDQGSHIDPATIIVFQEYTNISPKVYEANAMSEEMNKGVVFMAQIKNLSVHDDLGRPRHKEVIIRVTSKNTNKVWIWSKEKFVNRKYLIAEMYVRWVDGETADVDHIKDPFWDPVEDVYLGSCHVWLNSVAYCMDLDEYMDIRNHHGREVAQLHSKVAPCDKKGKLFKDEAIVFDPSQLEGRALNFMVMLPQARDVQWVKEDNTRGTYCSFYDHPQAIKTKVVWGSMNPRFDFKEHITIPQVGHDLLRYLQSHALVIELWGTQALDEEGSNSDTNISKSSDIKIKELTNALAKKEAEASRMRAERDKARTDLAKYTVNGTMVDSRSSSSSSDVPNMVVNDPCPSPRRRSMVPRSSMMIQGSTATSLDAEMAKALKIFFRDVKYVQNKLGNIKTTGERALSAADDPPLIEVLEPFHNSVVETDRSLNVCVGALKDSMMDIIRKKKEGHNTHGNTTQNGHH